MSRGAAPYRIIAASWCFGEAMSLLWMWCEWRWMAMVSLAENAEMVPRDGHSTYPGWVVVVVTYLLWSDLSEIVIFHNRGTYEPTSIIRWDGYLSGLGCCFWFHRFVMFHPLLVGFGSSTCCLWTHHTYRWHQQFGSGIGCGPVEHYWKLPLLQVRVFRIISWWFHRCLPWNHRVAPTQSSQLKDSHWWKIGRPCDLPNLNIWNPQKVGDIPSSSADSMEVKVGISPKWVINDDKCLSKCVPIPFINCDSMSPRFILG